LKEWTTPDSRNTPSTTNLEEEKIVDAPGNDGKASMPEQFKRPNPWRGRKKKKKKKKKKDGDDDFDHFVVNQTTSNNVVLKPHFVI
jgi:hypothetical protein